MLESERDASVVRAILDITRSFELDSIGEGIERDVQRIRLFREGCVHGQGYLFGRPMCAADMEVMIAAMAGKSAVTSAPATVDGVTTTTAVAP